MRKLLLTTLALAVAATPAVAHRGGDASEQPKPPAQERPATAKGPKGTHYLLHACVVGNVSPTGVDLAVLGGNRHMKRVLDGATTYTAELDAATLVRLVGKARHTPEGSTPKRLPKIGSHADLATGDRVIVRFRTPGVKPRQVTPGLDLPAAFKVIDRGPSRACATGTPPADDPKDDTPDL
jgi:hypothetical protein